jgi:hypothetical protein
MSTEDPKPEWFQMAQTEVFATKPRGKKVLRIMALATPLFVLGAGLALAQSQTSPSNVLRSAAAAQTSTVAPATPATPTSSLTPATSTSTPVQISHTTGTTQRAAITIAKPGSKLPTGGEEDDSSQAIFTSPNVATTSPTATITKPGITNPAIATLPTRSGDDDHKTSNDGNDD